MRLFALSSGLPRSYAASVVFSTFRELQQPSANFSSFLQIYRCVMWFFYQCIGQLRYNEAGPGRCHLHQTQVPFQRSSAFFRGFCGLFHFPQTFRGFCGLFHFPHSSRGFCGLFHFPQPSSGLPRSHHLIRHSCGFPHINVVFELSEGVSGMYCINKVPESSVVGNYQLVGTIIMLKLLGAKGISLCYM
jgi:hypothetical protein